MAKLKYLGLILVVFLTFIDSTFAASKVKASNVEVTGDRAFIPIKMVMYFNALSEYDRERYILQLYLKARETYKQEHYDHNYYDFVRLYSAEDVYDSFKGKLEDGSNMDSPLLLGTNERIIKVQDVKITKPGPSASFAVIKFISEDVDRLTGARFNMQEKTAKVKFTPLNIGKMTVNSLNPFNFQVLGYQISNGKE